LTTFPHFVFCAGKTRQNPSSQQNLADSIQRFRKKTLHGAIPAAQDSPCFFLRELLEHDLPDQFLLGLVQFFQAALDVVYEDYRVFERRSPIRRYSSPKKLPPQKGRRTHHFDRKPQIAP